jgi:hypothetical protein
VGKCYGCPESKIIAVSSEKAMKKKLLLTFIFSVSVFFIVLGMRNPVLEKNSGPKQRPRAITENVVKASQEICSKISTAADMCPPVDLQLPVPGFSPFVQNNLAPSFSIPGSPSSRASPRTFSA